MAVVHTILPSGIQDFPCKYLGPSPFYEEINEISITAFDIENCWYREIADCLPGWKAELLNMADLAIFVQSMLTTTLVYSATALDLPPWCLKAMDKLRRNFLWRGRKEANGSHCLIAWPKVSRPKELVCTCVLKRWVNWRAVSWSTPWKCLTAGLMDYSGSVLRGGLSWIPGHLGSAAGEVVLQPEDEHIQASGQSSTKSAYEALFYGAMFFEHIQDIHH